MFPPVPPRQDPPPRPEPEPEVYEPPLREPLGPASIARPGPAARTRILVFALVGGGITSIVAGVALGTIAGLLEREQPFALLPPGGTRTTFGMPSLALRVFQYTVGLAPWLFLIFALAAAAQTVVEGLSRAANRAARMLGDALGEPQAERRPRRPAERRPAAPGTAAEIVRPLAQDLDIDSGPPANP